MVATSAGSAQTLFDFTRADYTSNWVEASDTIKSNGMSKAVMVIQKTQMFQRAVFFTLFIQRPSGSGFAAVRCDTNFDISECQNIIMKCRGHGINYRYKILLRHKGLDKNSVVYGQVFTAPETDFNIVKLPLLNFKPYYRGQELSLEQNPLDTSAITSISFKIDSSFYLPENQPGVSALEVDWIKAAK
ncbi:uncharacterized protein [Prorops nasuta]|uniref:uncharacterized protein n=1 Tax=Prorops nasuta TaxID=863751 RepID=UPI0034CE7B25